MNRRLFKHLFWLAPLVALAAPPPPPTTVRAEDILSHLEHTIAWYRNIQRATDLPGASGELLVRQNTRQSSLKALQLAFDFARAEANLLALARQPAPESRQAGAANGRNLMDAAQRAADRISNVQTRLNDLNAALAKAPAKAVAALEAQRRELQAELDLAKEVQKTIQGVISFAGGGVAGSAGGLAGQINDLERSVPEAHHDERAHATSVASSSPNGAPAASSAPSRESANPFRADSAGLFSLGTQAIELTRSAMQLQDVIGATDAMLAETDRLRVPLASEIRKSIQRSDALSSDSASQDVQQLNSDRQEIEILTAQFKQISTALAPLAEQGVATGAARGSLNELLDAVKDERGEATRYLFLRSAALSTVIVVLLIVSAIWRRATFRYVRDIRRRRQFMLMRRVIFGFTLTLVFVLGFISDFGSLATYAGFLTAGIAVALQNVLLAVVAYFFLIGRYGVKIGDKVTISGVTGNVVEIGLVRIYLMELAGQGADLHPTGRIVVFSNAVLFSTSALFKQMPGADFVWHRVTLALAPESPFEIAHVKLGAAVDQVFEQYRDKIDRKHAALEESVDLQIAPPRPECRLRLTDKGLEFSVHYPAEMQRASATDDTIIRALRDAVDSEEKLKFAPGGLPRLDS
jgi:small-conductance mechanosensitive channel